MTASRTKALIKTWDCGHLPDCLVGEELHPPSLCSPHAAAEDSCSASIHLCPVLQQQQQQKQQQQQEHRAWLQQHSVFWISNLSHVGYAQTHGYLLLQEPQDPAV